MPDSHLEYSILKIIEKHVGVKNAIKDKDIRNLVEVPDPDKEKPTAGLRIIINTLRSKGVPICSGTQGYWWAESYSDLKLNMEALEGRAIKIFEATKGMKACLSRWGGQDNLPL